MSISSLPLFSCLKKTQPSGRSRAVHAMLAGLNQGVFIRHWGRPEFNVRLDQMLQYIRLDLALSGGGTPPNERPMVWIYRERDRFLIFQRGKLVVHFKWSTLWRTAHRRSARDQRTGVPPKAAAA
jgi:hypothetical protein